MKPGLRNLAVAVSAIAFASLQSFALDTKIFTFVGDRPMVTHTTCRAETCDLAIHLDNPFLNGKKVTRIRVLTDPKAQPMEDFKVWLSMSLNLEENEAGENVNAPDILSVSGTPDSEGWLDVTLPEPYTLTDKGVYAGYSFTITEYSGDGGKPIPYSQDRHPGGFWFHGTKSAIEWMDCEDQMNGVLPVYVYLEGEYPPVSVAVSGWDTEFPYVQIDREFSLPVKMMNLGSEPIREITYRYTVQNSVGEGKVTLVNPIVPDIVDPTTLYLTFGAVTELGGHTVRLDLREANGEANGSEFSGIDLPVECRTLVPVKRVLLEEGTGTWCSACPRGAAAIESLNSLYGTRVIAAAYHAGNDPMSTGARLPASFSYFPGAVLNRGDIIDPYYGDDHTLSQAFAIRPLVDEALDLPAEASVEVMSEWIDEAHDMLDVSAETVFPEGYSGKFYKMLFILTADGLKGPSPLWDQANGLANWNQDSYDENMKAWAAKGNPIVGLEYDHVVLLANAAYEGVPLPDAMEPAETFLARGTFNLKKAVSVFERNKGESLVQDENKLSVIALLVDADGHVVNCAKAPVGGSSLCAVDVFTSEECRLTSTEYYDISGRRLSSDVCGIQIRISRYSDGSVKADKILR